MEDAYHSTMMCAALIDMPDRPVPGAYSQAWLERRMIERFHKRG